MKKSRKSGAGGPAFCVVLMQINAWLAGLPRNPREDAQFHPDLAQCGLLPGSEDLRQMWQTVASAPFDRDIELAVIDGDGPHTLVFACRRVLNGWIKAETKERLDVRPTHWREWKP
ncbi:MAG TPA: hypothetical protein VMT22_04135 [Terriglobales bacterium]|nr:hypothetical protein [Terriglobales bacterium]